MYTVQLHSGCVHSEEALPLSVVLLQALSPWQQLQICTSSVVCSLHHVMCWWYHHKRNLPFVTTDSIGGTLSMMTTPWHRHTTHTHTHIRYMATGSGTMADVYSAMALPGPEQTLSRKQSLEALPKKWLVCRLLTCWVIIPSCWRSVLSLTVTY